MRTACSGLDWSSYMTNSTLRFVPPTLRPPEAFTWSRHSSYVFSCGGVATARMPVRAIEKPMRTGLSACDQAGAAAGAACHRGTPEVVVEEGEVPTACIHAAARAGQPEDGSPHARLASKWS